MIMLRKILPVFAILIMVAACNTTQPEMEAYREPRFSNQEVISLKVRQIDIVSEFTPSFTRPNVEHLFPVSIEKTAKVWAKDRLKASDYSSDKVATVIIKDASVTEEMEKSEQLLQKDRIRYRANLSVVLRINDTKSMSKAETEVVAWRELIIPADTDIGEKEKYWNGMVNKLFEEYNAKMDQNIRRYLNMHVQNNEYIQSYQ